MAEAAALGETIIRRHLERFCPPVGSEPHVWVAHISARAEDADQWLDIGPLDAVCKAYPRAGEILRNWTPSFSRSLSGVFNLTPELRCRVALIGEARRG